MFTEKFGTHQCLLAARENVMRVHHTTVDDAIINRVFRFGTADINEKYLKQSLIQRRSMWRGSSKDSVSMSTTLS